MHTVFKGSYLFTFSKCRTKHQDSTSECITTDTVPVCSIANSLKSTFERLEQGT